NMCGGHLPPYLHSGLVIILVPKTCPICAIPTQYVQWTSTIIFAQWTGDYFGPQDLSNMCDTYPICAVDIYHHICTVDWWLFWSPRPVQYVRYLPNMCSGHLPSYLHSGLVIILVPKTCPICAIPTQYVQWTSTIIFAQWTGDYFGPQGLSNMCGGHLPSYLH